MKIKFTTVLVAVVTACLYTFCFTPALADGIDREKWKAFCTEALSTTPTYFTSFGDSAHELRQTYCATLDMDAFREAVVSAMVADSTPFTAANGIPVNGSNQSFTFNPIINSLASMPLTLGVPNFQSRRTASTIELGLGSLQAYSLPLDACTSTIQQTYTDATCMSYFSEFKDVYTFAQQTVAAPVAEQVWQVWDAAEKEWNRYFDEGRSQYPWEYFANYAWWARSKRAGEVGTPLDYQIILLHPSPVIENVKDARDGENTEPALMIEVVGINYWQSDKWYQPTGASLVTIHADRDEVRDWAYGVAVHFNNNLTIGMASHEHENGIFISVDLLNALFDTESRIKEIRSQFLGQ
ncbi:hypothetical protein [Alteromonas antoniana]|uniref:hypothetical protein n=1 Tax=Alteromonas antoniana TaxID=2803813 RepID=UPI001C45506A|nr:hypothetical protein [Alteromonas antoniana]